MVDDTYKNFTKEMIKDEIEIYIDRIEQDIKEIEFLIKCYRSNKK